MPTHAPCCGGKVWPRLPTDVVAPLRGGGGLWICLVQLFRRGGVFARGDPINILRLDIDLGLGQGLVFDRFGCHDPCKPDQCANMQGG